MSKIFLTGASGLVGSFVAQKLLEHKHDVVCLVRQSSNLKWIDHLPVKLVTGSLFQPESYKDSLVDVDYILHVAGVTKAFDRETYYQGNVRTTKLLLSTAYSVNPKLKRFLFVSSQAAVGPSPSEVLIDESHPLNPITDYGLSKKQAEEATREFGEKLPITIVRPPVVYGPRDSDVFIFFKYLKSGYNLKIGSYDQYVSLVFVEDLAEGIIQAALSENSIGKIYFICEDQPFYWSEVAKLTAEIMKVNYRTIRIPYSGAYLVSSILELFSRLVHKPTILNRQKMREVRLKYLGISPANAKIDFNYQTKVPLSEGIRITYQWYKHAGWLK